MRLIDKMVFTLALQGDRVSDGDRRRGGEGRPLLRDARRGRPHGQEQVRKGEHPIGDISQ